MMKMVQNTFEPPDIVTSWWRHQDYRMTSWKFSNKRKFTDRKYERKSRKWFWKVWKLDRYEWTMMTSSAMMTSSDKSRRSRTWKIRLSRWLTFKVIALTSLNQTTFRIQCSCTTIAEKSEILLNIWYLSGYFTCRIEEIEFYDLHDTFWHNSRRLQLVLVSFTNASI